MSQENSEINPENSTDKVDISVSSAVIEEESNEVCETSEYIIKFLDELSDNEEKIPIATTSMNNSKVPNENTSEDKKQTMIIRKYPSSPIRDSELNLDLQSTPCDLSTEKYPVFQKYFPSNDDHELSHQTCHMENDTADLIGSTQSLLFKNSTEESMQHSELEENVENNQKESKDTDFFLEIVDDDESPPELNKSTGYHGGDSNENYFYKNHSEFLDKPEQDKRANKLAINVEIPFEEILSKDLLCYAVIELGMD